jgi:hypothetical protein
MITPDRKVRKLMETYQETGKLSVAALRADLDRKTARKYLETGLLPSELKREHTWRTRTDPFAGYWGEAEEMLRGAPELEAKALFEWLSEQHADAYDEGQLRTFQRRVRTWRALSGPPKEVYFPQEHKPGVKMETDFTWMNELKVTICGEPFPHLLCHSVLTYSNWEWGVVCQSESFLALRKGVQTALMRLGRIPREHWTDHTTAATHVIGGNRGGIWEYNRNYLDMMEHFGIAPHTIQVSQPHENGDVESGNGALKRRIEQHLLLRGSRDFRSVEEYEAFIEGAMARANRLRQRRFAEELDVMRLLDVRLLPEYREDEVRVTSWSTVQVDRNTYSVPSRLRDEKVKARVYEEKVEIYFHGVRQLTVPRLPGERGHAVNYRHVIDSLVRKPGAFKQYKFRQDMFPTEEFRWAYDTLCVSCTERLADMEYLRILQQAALTMESRVQEALGRLRASGTVPRWDAVLELAPAPRPQVPEMPRLQVNLEEYDSLLVGQEVAV